MESWRIFATALFGAAALTLILFVLAKVREKTDSAVQTAIVGAVVTAAAVLIGVLMITVLPPAVAWTLVVIAGVTVTVMVLAS